jgi:FMN phosphatase YigB (HAD superfamily)
MKTIIFDIDGTLTDMWPIEEVVLLYMTNGKYKGKINALKLSGISDTCKIYKQVWDKNISKKNYFNFYNKSFNTLIINNKFPAIKKYPLVKWIKNNVNKYNFVYATGGQRLETLYVLRKLGLLAYFDIKNSIDKSNCRFSKKTGIPFNMIKKKFNDCLLITDSKNDCTGAVLVKVPFILLGGEIVFRFCHFGE